MSNETTTLINWVVPVYNGERYIEQSIRSILDQPCKDLRVIVIDDGSVDSTAAIVKGINDNRVRYVYKENGGVSSARNIGIECTESRYIAFLDADDILCRGIYDEKLHDLLKSSQYDILSFAYFMCDQNLKRGNRRNTISVGEIGDGEMRKDIYKQIGSFIFSANLFNRYPFLRFPAGIKYCEDISFIFLSLCCAKRMVCIDRAFIMQRNNIVSAIHNFVSYNYIIDENIPAWYWCKGKCTRESDRNECDARLFADVTSYIQYGCMYGIPVAEIQRKLDNPIVKETIQNYEALWNSRKIIWEKFMEHPDEYWKKMRRKGYFVSAARMLVHIPVIRSCWHRITYKTDIRSFV